MMLAHLMIEACAIPDKVLHTRAEYHPHQPPPPLKSSVPRLCPHVCHSPRFTQWFGFGPLPILPFTFQVRPPTTSVGTVTAISPSSGQNGPCFKPRHLPRLRAHLPLLP